MTGRNRQRTKDNKHIHFEYDSGEEGQLPVWYATRGQEPLATIAMFEEGSKNRTNVAYSVEWDIIWDKPVTTHSTLTEAKDHIRRNA